METMIQNGQNGSTQKNPVTSWDLGVALRRVYDDMEKAIIDGILLGDLVQEIKLRKKDGFDGQYAEVDKIEWGIQKRYVTAEVKSLFKVWGYRETENGYEYEVQGVPVKLKVIERNYKFFEHPDTVFYGVDEFKIPNPFEKYWKARFIIK